MASKNYLGRKRAQFALYLRLCKLAFVKAWKSCDNNKKCKQINVNKQVSFHVFKLQASFVARN